MLQETRKESNETGVTFQAVRSQFVVLQGRRCKNGKVLDKVLEEKKRDSYGNGPAPTSSLASFFIIGSQNWDDATQHRNRTFLLISLLPQHNHSSTDCELVFRIGKKMCFVVFLSPFFFACIYFFT